MRKKNSFNEEEKRRRESIKFYGCARAQIISGSVSFVSALLLSFLHPRRHIIHALKRVKLIWVLIQFMTLECELFVFFAIIVASFFRTTSHSFPHPPDTEKTSGVKDPFSISLILFSYFFFFSFSCCLRRVGRDLLA